MNKQELVDFLSDNLRINIMLETKCYSSTTYVKVQLLLEDQKISEDFFTIPESN